MTYRDDPEIAKKYKSAKWKKLRAMKLAMNPLCERCLAKGISNSSHIVHHKEYITDKNYFDDDVFYNIDNLECLCQACHNEEHFGKEQEYKFDLEGNVIRS